MHVVTGGAYNGKSAWVRKQLKQIKKVQWINAYVGEKLPDDMQNFNKCVVFEGVEQWVFQWLDGLSLDEARKFGRQIIKQWQKWEQQHNERQLIIIGTDISKGIVPIDEKMRKWRDVTGWFYQDLIEKSERVDLVWYGIGKRLK